MIKLTTMFSAGFACSKAGRQRAIVLTKMLYACKGRRYLPCHLSVSHTHRYAHTHTHTLPPQRLSSWLERAIETSDKGAETTKGRIRAGNQMNAHTRARTHIHTLLLAWQIVPWKVSEKMKAVLNMKQTVAENSASQSRRRRHPEWFVWESIRSH